MGPRRDGVPALVGADGRFERLERLPFSEREINEGWLQKRLFECPDLLPVAEIDPAFAPLVPIGCEIATDVGPMDNLYVSPHGLLTLVEAKLWRNPQARREVIGQIIDYAKEMARWSYDDLDRRARERSGSSLYELVSTSERSPDERDFVDAVSRNLRAGRFLLLIAGDGMREEMERLADFLQATPQLRFTLALIELQLYRLPDDPRLLVMPILVGRTTEIVRAVVHVQSSEGAQVQVSLEIDGDEVGVIKPSRRRLTYDTFFQELATSGVSAEGVAVAKRLYEDFENDDRFTIDWRSSSYVIKLRDPLQRSSLYTLLVVERGNKVWMGWLLEQLSRTGAPVELGRELISSLGQLLGRELHRSYESGWSDPASLDEVALRYDEVRARIVKFAEDLATMRERPEESAATITGETAN